MYEINIYTYKDKKSGIKHVVYARTLAAAQEIMDICNTENCVYWIPKRFGFIRKTYVRIPPYELELAQFEYAVKQLEHRKEYYKRKEETG